MDDLDNEFNKHQTNGYLGDPLGIDSYAYMRASSERQVEEGSSFSRQIENIHKAAQREGLRVPIGLIFFDDGFSGFDFEHRPALLKLRFEIRSSPLANHLIIEDIDRLSRNADWQQGFLLEELFRANIGVHFYINPGSSLERYIRGYMAQEEMRKAKERMRMGNLYKAMDGKVTAKRPRYGYVLTPDSFYELHPEESKVIRWVYEKIIYHRLSLYKIAIALNNWGIPTRFKTKFWTASTLYQLVKSPIYKGDFYANQHYAIPTGEYKATGKPKIKTKIRPKEEWIHVPVPAIVTPDEWQQALEIMKSNAKKSARNTKKYDWLLVSLLKCAICRKYSFTTQLGRPQKNRKRYYKCNSLASEKARGNNTSCKSPYVDAHLLERRVWEEIENFIYDPTIVLGRLEEKALEEKITSYEDQLSFIENQLSELTKEQEKFEAAYKRDIYTIDEFEEKMKDLRFRKNALEVSQSKMGAKIAESNSFEEKKEIVCAALDKIRAIVEKARKQGQMVNEIPFDLKRKILTLIVDVVWVNAFDETFSIEGEINGTFVINDEDESDPVGNISTDFGLSSSQK